MGLTDGTAGQRVKVKTIWTATVLTWDMVNRRATVSGGPWDWAVGDQIRVRGKLRDVVAVSRSKNILSLEW